MKGLKKVELEFRLMALGHNCRKVAMKLTNHSYPVDKTQKLSLISILYELLYTFLFSENCFPNKYKPQSQSNKIIT